MFYIFASLAILSGLGVVLLRNLLYVALSLLVTLLSLAAIYVLLYADFVAVTQLMVYVGGVLVLILFGIMLSSRSDSKSLISETINKVWGTIAALAVGAGLIYLIMQVPFQELPWQQEHIAALHPKTTLPAIGINLMTTFVLPFEVASLLLLIALIGAAFISASNRKHD